MVVVGHFSSINKDEGVLICFREYNSPYVSVVHDFAMADKCILHEMTLNIE